ncbi:hypothetical protein FXO37_09354 [Capsicum annuum]|nr:hypothetical protein FXO37_09354 [Capsicum annuum]
MMQLIQVMRLTYLIKEVKPESTSVEKQPEKVTGKGVDAGDEKDTADSSSIVDWEEKDEFKGICDGLAAIRNPVNKENKVINFARGLGLKYKAFRTVMLGATSHMTNNSSTLSNLKYYNGNDKIIVGNGSQLDITHVGNTIRSGLKLQDVLIVPKIAKNLLSVSKIAKDNSCTLEFDETDFVVKDKKTRTLLAKGYKRNRIYALKDNHLYALTARQDWKTSDNIWNNRLGNPSLKILNYLNSSSCINVSSWDKMHVVCSSCQLGKGCKLPFGLRNKIEKEPLLKIHWDLWGPAPVESTQHMRYYVVFVNDNTRYTWLYPLKN